MKLKRTSLDITTPNHTQLLTKELTNVVRDIGDAIRHYGTIGSRDQLQALEIRLKSILIRVRGE